jgi:AcrR family transcriptional regulator
MPRSPKPAPPPAPRPPLTRDRIAAAALALIDEAGLDGCTMRRLGAALGVEAMALYHHFPGKGPLLDAVMDLLVDEIEMAPPGSAPALERLRASLRSYRAIALRHPRAFLLMAARRFNTPRAFAKYEQLLATFAELGLDPEGQAHWFRLLGGHASAAGMAYAASIERVPHATPLQLQHAPQQIPYPHVRAAAPFLQVDALETAFEFGLDVLIDALARRASATAGVRKGSESGTCPQVARPTRRKM